MSSSPNEAAALPPAVPAARAPRLAAALAASFALHASAIVVLEALPQGMRWGDLVQTAPGAARRLRVSLRAVEPGPSNAAGEEGRTAYLPPPPWPPPAEGAAPAAGAPPGSAFAPLPLQHYYTTRELDVRPGILVRVEPEYPEGAARRFLSGRVVARLLIDASGAVEKVEIVSAEPPGYFEESAAKAFRAARFTPGMKGGRAVPVQLLLEISFDSPLAPKPSTTGA